MGKFKVFEESEVWKKARHLCNKVYNLSDKPPFSRDFVLRDQIRRAAVSVMSNIAEGVERSGNPELIQFLSIAKGSCGEVRSLLHLASDRRYIRDEERVHVINECFDTSRMIAALMNYLRESNMKGFKYREDPAPYESRVEL